MEKKLTFGIIGWDEKHIDRLRTDLIKQEVTTEDRIIVRDATHFVAGNFNDILDAAGTDLVYMLTADIEIVNPDWVDIMYQYMEERSNVGILYCWNDGRAFYDQAPVYPNPVGTGANLMIRQSFGVCWDEEFIFSQFEDQDIGREMQHQGYRVCFDQRVSVFHPPTDYSKKDLLFHTYSIRNRLLLETKWRAVNRDDWRGIDWWNDQNGWYIASEDDLYNWKPENLNAYRQKCEEIVDGLLKKELLIV